MFSKATLLLVVLSALELSVSALPSDHIRRSHSHIGKRVAAELHPKRSSSCKVRPTSTIATASSSATAQASTTAVASSAKFTSAASSSEAESSSKAAKLSTQVKVASSSAQASSSSEAKSSSAKASASSSAAPSSSTYGTSLVGQLASFLFPSGGSSTSQSSAWTTAPQLTDALPLADSTFNVEKDMTEMTHNYVSAPDGSTAMQAIYPEGSYQLTHAPYGGISFYATGPSDVDLSTAKEATFGYSIWFEDGFDFQLGGKLPGLYGGNDAETAVSCSGGRISSECFSARLMWRTNGAGEMYTYLPPISDYPSNEAQCNQPPYSTCNPQYGASVGRGSYTFKTGAWNTVTERVKLNDEGQSNGELELYFNGNSVINVGGLVLRDSSAGRIWGIQMQTFFGGSTSDYASPKTQSTYFKDFTVSILESL